MPRRLLIILLHRLDRSPLPGSDPVRLDLEAELLKMLAQPRRDLEAELRCGWLLGPLRVGST